MLFRLSAATLLTLVSLVARSVAAEEPNSKSDAGAEPWNRVATFSILGYDPDTGEVGAAVQSRVFCVGNGVIWAEADVGAVATQSMADIGYGPVALGLLKKKLSPADVLKQTLEEGPDPKDWPKEGRQLAVISMQGETAAYTGPKSSDWAGHKSGKNCTAQGNILASEEVVNKMVEGFEKAEGHLSRRLLAALEGGQEAGGDKRGMQSAAMIIVKKNGGPWLRNDTVLRLQVDDNEEPIKELRRLVEKANVRKRVPKKPDADAETKKDS
jgi:uncharacterized Ntn-hydrolase superfamily protein